MANLHQLLLYGRPKAPFLPRVRHHQIRPFSLEVEGARLHGWLAMPRGPARGAMLYFNGRRESPTTVFRFLDVLEYQAVAVFHYRGLGPSSGVPAERVLVADGLVMLDWLCVQTRLPEKSIVIMGRSLGSGIAVQVAATRAVAGLILISAFDSLAQVVRRRFGAVPGLLLRDKFHSVGHMGRVRCPVLSITGARDTTIPVAHTRSLLAGWEGHLQEFQVPEGRHRGLLRYASVQGAIAAFFAGLGF